MNSNIALYRKYRPKDFSEVVGQKNIVNTLKNSIINNNILHAYIFSGTRGTGKTTIAKIFAKALNCLDLQDGFNPCLKCENCKLIDENQTTDIIELDAASNNGVDEIRTIIDNVMYLPQRLKKKVYIIDEAHMLSNSAWNALLKTLEEPPAHVVFILATTEFHKIPITIVSRCQRYDFYGLDYDDLNNLIDIVTKKENIKISLDAKDKLIQLSDTAARDCLSILEQLAIYSNNNISIEEINKVFGLVDLNFIIKFIDILINKDISNFIKYVAVLEKNYDINYFIDQIINCLIDYLVYIKTNDKTMLKVLNEKQLNNEILKQEKHILELLDTFYLILKDIKTKGNPIFYLKYHLFEKITDFKNNTSVNNIIQIKQESNVEPLVQQTNESVNGRKLLKKPSNIQQTVSINLEENNLNIDNSINEYNENINESNPESKTFSTIKINQIKEEAIIETKKDVIKEIDKFDIYKRLALNNQKSEVVNLNTKLKQAQESIGDVSIDEADKLIQKIQSFYLFSNNVAFIISNNQTTANRFNELFLKDIDFRNQIRSLLGFKKLYIFAIAKTEAIKYNNQIKESSITEIEQIDYSKMKTIFNELDDADIRAKIQKIKNKQ